MLILVSFGTAIHHVSNIGNGPLFWLLLVCLGFVCLGMLGKIWSLYLVSWKSEGIANSEYPSIDARPKSRRYEKFVFKRQTKWLSFRITAFYWLMFQSKMWTPPSWQSRDNSSSDWQPSWDGDTKFVVSRLCFVRATSHGSFVRGIIEPLNRDKFSAFFPWKISPLWILVTRSQRIFVKIKSVCFINILR